MGGPPAAAKRFNTVAIHLAGHRVFPPWAVLHHRGRTSGRAYATPVAVIPVGRTIVIGLPWGRGTDWVRNVMAAGGCTVTWKGVEHACVDPRFVDNLDAAAGARGLARFTLHRMNLPEGCLQLTLAS